MKKEIATGIDGLEEDIFADIDSDFVNVVQSFYGDTDSIYGKEFFPPCGATLTEIIVATKIRKLINTNSPFHGDSMDREIVRDIITQMREKLAEIIVATDIRKLINTIVTKK